MHLTKKCKITIMFEIEREGGIGMFIVVKKSFVAVTEHEHCEGC